MHLAQLVDPRLIRCHWSVNSKKQLLQTAADSIAQHSIGVDSLELFECLTRREKLGSTALGFGAAIPHCRSTPCQKVTGFLATLVTPIAFDAPDLIPVDLVFVLMVPGQCSDNHVELLDQLTQLLCRPDAALQLRQANTDTQLYSTFVNLCETQQGSSIQLHTPVRSASA